MQGQAHLMRQGVTQATLTAEITPEIEILDTDMQTFRRRFPATPIVMSGLALAAVLTAAGCSGGDEENGPPDSSSSGPTTPGFAPAVDVGTVAGKLPTAAEQAAITDLGGVVTKWLDSAYLGGDYPRTTFETAFGTFTEGAAKLAGKDPLTSNASHGGEIESVTPSLETVHLDLVADHKKVIGATARFRLEFTTAGAYAKHVTVAGRVFLTPGANGGWRIFGYDLTRGDQ